MSDSKPVAQTFSTLAKVQIENFKSIKKTSLEMAPLTILIGVNSRGKSTILQSILLVAQSITRTKLGEVSLNGEAVTLGTADEVFRRSDSGRLSTKASIGLEVAFGEESSVARRFQGAVSRINETFFFDRRLGRSRRGVVASRNLRQTISRAGEKDETEFVTLDISMTESLGRSVFKIKKNQSNRQYELQVRTKSLPKGHQARYLMDPEEGRGKGAVASDLAFLLDTHQLLEHNLYSPGSQRWRANKNEAGADRKGEQLSAKALGEELEAFAFSFHGHFLSRSIPIQDTAGFPIHYLPKIDGDIFREWLSLDRNQKFVSLMDSLTTKEGRQALEEFASRTQYMRERFLGSPSRSFDEIKYFWSHYLSRNIQYLGPLREKDALSAVGKLDFSDLTPLGPKAEFLADFVFEKQNEEIDFPLPMGAESTRQSYLNSLEAWACDYFQLGESLEVSEEGRFGPVLRVDGNRLLHLGTGVSQILPVIALCLWAKPGSTIILEQPELHLHPGLQQKLGTFLTVVSSTGRQVIVETHSEYLLTRVRRHIAESHIPEESCTLVFVQDDGSVVQRPALTGGDGEEWPEQFLDHTLDDAIAIASLRESHEGSD